MKNDFFYNLFFLGVLIIGGGVKAQSVSGTVSDDTGPLPQVNITVKGTPINTVSDVDGRFTINKVEGKTILVFSYIGFSTKEIDATNQEELEVIMTPDVNSLDEVVVVGYVGQKKASVSTASTAVDMNDISKTRVPDVAQALQGQIAGVFVAANTGAPGDGLKIRIRGEGTLGNNDVLYVVDGVPTRNISFLNTADVKSMTVLKDAAAGAVYGSRAAGGVILITTKGGEKGKSAINVEFFSGFYFATQLPKMLNTEQYLSVKDQAWHNTAGNASTAISPYAADRSRTDLANTNWQDELFTTGASKNFQIMASGGSEKLQYLISGGYFGMDGIIVENHDKYQRVNFRANLNVALSERLKTGTNLQISTEKQDKLSSSGDAPGVIRHALIRPPVIGVYKNPSDPTYSARDPYTDLPFYTGPNNGWSQIYEFTSNPLAIVHFTDDKRNTFQTFGNIYAEYALLNDKALKFKSNLGVDIRFSHNKNFGENYGDPNINDSSNPFYRMGRNNRPNSLNENRGQDMIFTFSNTLNYVKTLNEKHSLNLLLGSESISSKSAAIGGSRQNYENFSNSFRYLDYGSLTNIYNSGSARNWGLMSYFTSGTYGFNNRYFVTGTMRADASSRFGPNNKWGYFPSVSGAWLLSKEPFLNQVNWLSNLKLRASWGRAGNQEIPDNAYETLVSSSGGIVNIIRYGNPDLKWETTTQTNFGIDLGILKNKLSFTADYFEKKTTDILLGVTLPATTVGVINNTIVNAGAVTNKGVELGLNFQDNSHPFHYNLNLNVATLTNKVNKLQTYVPNIFDNPTHTITTVGQPISSYYGLVFDGIYQNTTEVNKTLFSNTNGTQPGDIKFKDTNADGQINGDDRAIIGNPIPRLTYGLSFSGNYKKFDISFLLQGVQGVDRYNDLKQILNYDSRPFNSTTAVLESWHGEGTSNTIPRLTFNNNGGGNVSSVFVEDASYLRLKNIELGYNFDLNTMGISNLRLYLSRQNVFTSTKYTGLDPESTGLLDQGTYPQSKAFIVGFQVKL